MVRPQARDAFVLNGRKVVTAWQERRQEEVRHPLLESRMPIALLPLTQARFIARTIRGEMEGYLPYLAR